VPIDSNAVSRYRPADVFYSIPEAAAVPADSTERSASDHRVLPCSTEGRRGHRRARNPLAQNGGDACRVPVDCTAF